MRANYLISPIAGFSFYICVYFVCIFVHTTVILTSSLSLILCGKIVKYQPSLIPFLLLKTSSPGCRALDQRLNCYTFFCFVLFLHMKKSLVA